LVDHTFLIFGTEEYSTVIFLGIEENIKIEECSPFSYSVCSWIVGCTKRWQRRPSRLGGDFSIGRYDGGRVTTLGPLLWRCRRCLSKWVYDTSTEADTGAVRCSSFVGKVLSLLVVSYR
jgi:hypothetical protein